MNRRRKKTPDLVATDTDVIMAGHAARLAEAAAGELAKLTSLDLSEEASSILDAARAVRSVIARGRAGG